ncbi:DedA family protein [Brenneria goodwinii]|nr:VTT domain-containing protein [Brenneria goodwinii]
MKREIGMFDLQTIETLIRAHGLMLLTPLAVIEGPIVTVIAAYMARLDYFSLSAVCVIVILGDLVGDTGFYALGRWVINPEGQPPKWLARLGLSRARLEKMVSSFDNRGGRILVFGKMTHSAGAVVLAAAGMARMNFGSFLFYNTLATIPKSLFFIAVGWTFGHAIEQVDHWMVYVSLALLILVVVVGVMWLRPEK